MRDRRTFVAAVAAVIILPIYTVIGLELGLFWEAVVGVVMLVVAILNLLVVSRRP